MINTTTPTHTNKPRTVLQYSKVYDELLLTNLQNFKVGEIVIKKMQQKYIKMIMTMMMI